MKSILLYVSVFVTLLSFNQHLAGQDKIYEFRHLSIDDGLSQNLVYSITQDFRDFMWFGTNDGLNRYDGVKFKIYYHDPQDSLTLIDNAVSIVFEDSRNQLWVGAGGLNHYDRLHDRFQRILGPGDFPGNIADNRIREIAEDHNGDLWVALKKAGLYHITFVDTSIWRARTASAREIQQAMRIDGPYPFNQKFVYPYPDIKKIVSKGPSIWVSHGEGVHRIDASSNGYFFPANQAFFSDFIAASVPDNMDFGSMLIDNEHRLWIGTSHGLLLASDPMHSDSLVFFEYLSQDEYNWTSIPRDMSQGPNGSIWMTTSNGVRIFDVENQKYFSIERDPSNEKSLSHNSVTDVFVDDSEIVWLGTGGMGINKFVSNAKRFKSYFGNDELDIHYSAYGLIEDRQGYLWVTFNDHLLGKFERGSNSQLIPSKKFPFLGVTSIALDQDGIVWFVSNNLLYGIDPETEEARSLKILGNKEDAFSSDSIPTLYIDDENMIWACNANTLYQLDRSADTLKKYDLPYKHLGHITALLRDTRGRFWIASENGLLQFDLQSSSFKLFRSDSELPGRLPYEFLKTLHLDPIRPDKYLWVGSGGGGLYRLDMENDSLKVYNRNTGLSNNYIYGILSDAQGHLWLSTNFGLSKLDPQNNETTVYTVGDGLQSYEFNSRSYFKSHTGEMFFGGINGVTAFYPEEIQPNPYIPSVVITDMFLSYNPVNMDQPNSPLDYSIIETDQLNLAYNQNTLAFEFAALDYIQPDKNQYRYFLAGFDQDWISAGSNNRATYTNLPPGNFTFQVQGANNDGLFNERGASIDVHIARAPWMTWWAFMGYAFLLLLFTYLLYRYISDKRRLRRALERKHLEAKKMAEVNDFKSRFFTNISHEFRTPLTLINGQLDQLMDNLTRSDLRDKVLSARHNTNQVMRLIDQLLDISRIESDKLDLHLGIGDIVSFLRQLTQTLMPLADKNGVELIFKASTESILMDFDRDVLQKIFQNLISNAIKFSPRDSKVTISLSQLMKDESHPEQEDQIIVEVVDEGPGIPEKLQKSIFDRFFQIDNTEGSRDGFGLGLTLVKELTSLHGGKIEVLNNIGVGSTFRVNFPQKNVREIEPENLDHAPISKVSHIKEYEDQQKISQQMKRGSFLILVVEDHDELRNFIISLLQKDYRIISAKNGKEGIKLARNYIPDMIISDIMMPDIDGYGLAQNILDDDRTSHIPILFLTALSSLQDRIKASNLGVDDYLVKPFQPIELRSSIKKLIQKRELLKEKYSKRFKDDNTLKETYSHREDRFLDKVRKCIENNLEDQNFGVEKLAQNIGMSDSNLYRKVLGLTNLSPVQMIQQIRVEKATSLLSKGLNISEAAYQAGFRSPSYFTQIFKKFHACTPSQYQKDLTRSS